MGLFSAGGGQDTGNTYLMGDPNKGDAGDYTRSRLQGLVQRGLDETENLNYTQGVSDVQNNPLQSMLFGQGGQMEQTNQRVNDLASKGYSLQPEDYEAYGQASGNIARMFGGQEQGLAQDMANRGLSNSGVAGAQFSGMYGNKQEQLAGLQTQIAQNRMQMNQQRLGQMQNFLGQLGNQAQQGINSANQTRSQGALQKYQTGTDYLGRIQQQNNEAMSQRMASAGPSTAEQIMGIGSMIGSGGGILKGIGAFGLGGSGKTPGSSSNNSGGTSSGTGGDQSEMSASDGGGAGSGGMLASLFSDKNLKDNISIADNEIQTFFKYITPYSYTYKNPKHGEGRYISPMAQDLEKSEAGKDLVINTPQGKMVDYSRAIGLILAAQSLIFKKLEEHDAVIQS